MPQVGRPVEAMVAAGGGLLALLALAATYPWWRFPAWGFFTRLLRPYVADQPTRQRILQLVQARPGIRAGHIARALGTGPGQTDYHLGVLARENLLTRTGRAFARRYFLKGAVSPVRMQQEAALATKSLAALHAAISREPGRTLAHYADRVQLSRGRVCRMVRQLEAVELVERMAAGRRVVLRSRTVER